MFNFPNYFYSSSYFLNDNPLDNDNLFYHPNRENDINCLNDISFQNILYKEPVKNFSAEKKGLVIDNPPNKLNEDDQLNDNNFKGIELKGQNYNNQFEYKTLGNIVTKATSKTLGHKRYRTEENPQNKGEKRMGRKKKGDQHLSEHNKFSEDNIMRKIKTHLLDYILNKLNDKLKNKEYKFVKLFSQINKNLKKDYNMDLIGKKIKDLYENSPISNKYRKQKDNCEKNKNIIKKIYEENTEDEVIDILESTYLDLLKEFRNNKNLNKFLNKIRNIEKEKGESDENINTYLRIMEKLCLEYEKWFEKKIGRRRNENI